MESYLADETGFKRTKAVWFCVKACSPEGLAEMLERYMSRDTYYYYVVCWFDRVLYAPGPLKAMYVRELEAE